MNPVPVPISEKIILIQIQCVTADASTFKTRTARIGWKPSAMAGCDATLQDNRWKRYSWEMTHNFKKGGGQVVRRKQGKVPLQFEKYKKMYKFLQIIELQQSWFYLTLWKGWICIFLQLVILQQNMNLQHMILTRKVSYITRKIFDSSFLTSVKIWIPVVISRTHWILVKWFKVVWFYFMANLARFNTTI